MGTIHPHGTVPFPVAMFLESSHMKTLALHPVLFIYVTSMWYVGKVCIVSILQMWKLGKLGSEPNSSDSKAHDFPTDHAAP